MYRPFIELKAMQDRVNGQGFFIDSVPLSDILALNISPAYITSLNAIKERIKLYQNAVTYHFKKNNIFYAMKANFAAPILEELKEAAAGVDIVSIGEWRATRKAKIPASQVCFSGVGKKENEWKEAISEGLGQINVEHLSELEDILNFLASTKLSSQLPVVSLRLNPCLDIETHPHLKTGALDSKFGILFEHFTTWIQEKKQQYPNSTAFLKWLSPLQGIHVHSGSQLMQQEIFRHVVQKILNCASFMQETGLNITSVNFGGGLGVGVGGVPADGSDVKNHVNFICSTFQDMAKSYPKLIKLWGTDFSHLFVSFEPGRSIVASSSIFLTSVLYEKKNSKDYLFCYVDGAMNDFPRPSIYGAVHQGELVNFSSPNDLSTRLKSGLFHWKVVGPVCESGDFLSQDCSLPQVKKGDIIAFFEAGAYCRSMASQYNLRPLPAEIFIKDGKIV